MINSKIKLPPNGIFNIINKNNGGIYVPLKKIIIGLLTIFIVALAAFSIYYLINLHKSQAEGYIIHNDKRISESDYVSEFNKEIRNFTDIQQKDIQDNLKDILKGYVEVDDVIASPSIDVDNETLIIAELKDDSIHLSRSYNKLLILMTNNDFDTKKIIKGQSIYVDGKIRKVFIPYDEGSYFEYCWARNYLCFFDMKNPYIIIK